jgi:hypothetical protein
VANHPVTRLADEARYRRWSAFASREERIVAYADKRCGQQLGPMAVRFASWERRYPPADGPLPAPPPDAQGQDPGEDTRDEGRRRRAAWDRATLARVQQRAERLEADVCRAAGIRPDQVRRLRWTADAFRRAGA